MTGPSSIPVTTLADGLPDAIDAVAVPEPHRFLRRAWYAAAGGTARTLMVTRGGEPILALPMVARGPAWSNVAEVPGSYWPLRSFPVAATDDAVMDAALDGLERAVRVLRIGPVPDGDTAAMPLIARARARGWVAIERFVADGWVLDLAGQGPGWPRASTLKKNRFHERHLAERGVLGWRYLNGGDWPDAFALLGDVERKSWIAARTDGRDAKFTDDGHLAFWRAAAADPVLAGMMRGALLSIDGQPAAFSFDLVTGATCYAVANSYDPAFAKQSPGKTLYWRNLVALRDRGVATVDWGAGDSGYKQTIGAVHGPALRDWLLVRPGITATGARLAAGLWRRSGNAEGRRS